MGDSPTRTTRSIDDIDDSGGPKAKSHHRKAESNLPKHHNRAKTAQTLPEKVQGKPSVTPSFNPKWRLTIRSLSKAKLYRPIQQTHNGPMQLIDPILPLNPNVDKLEREFVRSLPAHLHVSLRPLPISAESLTTFRDPLGGAGSTNSDVIDPLPLTLPRYGESPPPSASEVPPVFFSR